MRRLLITLLFSFVVLTISCDAAHDGEIDMSNSNLALPPPILSGETALEQALNKRRSVRQFSNQPLNLQEIGQLLWATQGISDHDRGFRTAPSAGATYPLEVLIVVADAKELAPGLYRYHPQGHELRIMKKGDLRSTFFRAALNQSPIESAPATIVITAVHERTETRYGGRAERYVAMEAGHAAQNLSLQAVALGLGTVVIGAFDDARIAELLALHSGESPLYLIPMGRP
ncbi:SagB-type dehydrogenase domain-containing protein [Desulfonatronum thiosulfatophilum]|uniref:SagB-type dehydrogenase domain-containing protein n=2 Tax=Desulfonatronum thiosulfatophilum TaxID=617002 RepID=A0A1G6CWU5_9BACT|nr:SagB-type dehydrogenase domain-containing protein [Desulfonatronum thiosulfatophilum]